MKQHDSSEYIICKCSEVRILMNGHIPLNFLSKKNTKYKDNNLGNVCTIRDSITFVYHLIPKSINIPLYHCMGITFCLTQYGKSMESVFRNRSLQKILGPKRDETKEELI